MRRVLPAALLFLVAARLSAGEGAAGFASDLPPGIANVTRWETVAGRIDTDQMRGGFLFYVNPRFEAIYQVMRYRVRLLTPTGDLEERRASTERVVYVRHPGLREPLQCWAAASAGGWREIVPGSEEYQMEMFTLIHVLAVHRGALTLAPSRDPAAALPAPRPATLSPAPTTGPS
jgi:hypothetical protein